MKAKEAEQIYSELDTTAEGLAGVLSVSGEFIDRWAYNIFTDMYELTACDRPLISVGLGHFASSHGRVRYYHPGREVRSWGPFDLEKAGLQKGLIQATGAVKRLGRVASESFGKKEKKTIANRTLHLARLAVAVAIDYPDKIFLPKRAKDGYPIDPETPNRHMAEGVDTLADTLGLRSVQEFVANRNKMDAALEQKAELPEVDLSHWESSLRKQLGWWTKEEGEERRELLALASNIPSHRIQ